MTLVLSMFSGVFKLLGNMLRMWPILALAAFFISPVGPHLRWEYQYIGSYSNKTYVRCHYMGSRGLIRDVPGMTPDCPFFTILDTRNYAR